MRLLRRAGLALFLVAVGPVFASAAEPKPDAAAITKLIDDAIEKRLASEKFAASPCASDAEFLRRVSLNITGVVPSIDRATAFLEDTEPDKRAKLIDELLASPEYARRMTDIWKPLLIPNTAASAWQKHEPIIQWLSAAFTANKGLDALARSVLTADGFQDENGAVTFYMATKPWTRSPTALLACSLACRFSVPSATSTRSGTGRRAGTGAWPRCSPR